MDIDVELFENYNDVVGINDDCQENMNVNIYDDDDDNDDDDDEDSDDGEESVPDYGTDSSESDCD